MQRQAGGDRAAEREVQDHRITANLAEIGRVLLVMSGKGGVGKSCMAVSIAAGLAARGRRVGLMDIDLHGPSIPQMLGMALRGEPDAEPDGRPGVMFSGDRMVPAAVGPNLSAISIECLLESADSPVIWRGPMKIGAIRQFISDVAWGKLDFLVIDSPPGTGDEPLTVAQTIPRAEAVIVTTPQRVAIRDVRKSIMFCRQTGMPVAGLIENMSGFACPSCGAVHALFKTGGGRQTAAQLDIPFLGAIPVIPDVVEACDNGTAAIAVSPVLAACFKPILDTLDNYTAATAGAAGRAERTAP